MMIEIPCYYPHQWEPQEYFGQHTLWYFDNIVCQLQWKWYKNTAEHCGLNNKNASIGGMRRLVNTTYLDPVKSCITALGWATCIMQSDFPVLLWRYLHVAVSYLQWFLYQMTKMWRNVNVWRHIQLCLDLYITQWDKIHDFKTGVWTKQ